MNFLFDDTINTTNITNVLLIDKDTMNYDIFYNSCNGSTFPIVYSNSCSRNDLLQLLNNKFTKINRLCFVFSFQPYYLFLNNELLFRNNETIPYSENVTFLINLINHFNISTVDYLACDTLIYENWQNYYNIILSNTTASVGASDDITGNIKYGGDWTMESTGQDIEAVYFNSNIQNYQNLLDFPGQFNVFLMNDNTIYGCGYNGSGELGLGNTTIPQTSLVQMPNNTGKTPVLVVGGYACTIVLMSDGTIYGCGYNVNGELGLGNTASPQTSLVQMLNTTGKNPVSISCGRYFTIVLMSDGTIYGCGKNDKGQLGDNSSSNRNSLVQMRNTTGKTPVAISAGGYHTLVLMSDGTMYGTGGLVTFDYGYGGTYYTLQPVPNNTGKTPSAIYASEQHTIVLMTDNTYYAVGYNAFLGVTQTTSPVAYLQQVINNTGKTFKYLYNGSYLFRMFLMSDYSIYVIGANGYGQLGTGDTTSQYSLVPMLNTTGKTPVSISCTYLSTLVLMSDGSIYGTGRNNFGQLGDGTTTNRSTLTLMPNNTGTTVKSFSGTTNPYIYKLTPTLSGFSIPTKSPNDDTFQITQPTSNSSGSFSYSSSNPSVATISGNTITIVGPGTSTITATQSETSYCSSGTITTTFIVENSPPTLSNFSISPKTFGDNPFTIPQPISNSDGLFSYSSSNTSVATISGNTITIVGVGTTTITATQAETTSYSSGTITTSFQVDKTTPSISGFSIETKTYGNSAFTITQPTSNSNGSFSYSSSDTSVATISGDTITIVGVGTTIITANQGETTDYSSGTITTSFQVVKATPSISSFSIETKTYGNSPFIITQPTSNSTGSFSYSSSNHSVATISGNTITIVGVGTATIIASQAETINYSSGTITTSFQVDKTTPSISGFSIPTKTYGDSPFTLTQPNSNSNGSFSYSSSDTSVATISENTITIVGGGTATIIATQEVTSNYTSGTITTTFQVDRASTTISDFYIPTKTYGDSPFTLTQPNSNSNGSFSYSSSDTSVATISENTITIVGGGNATITATQEVTSNYTSGTLTTSFQVDKAITTITDFYIPTKIYGDSPFTLTQPTSNSNGSFSYSSSDTSVATISGNTITIVGVGITTITATQTQTTNYSSGTITTTFQVDKTDPSINGFSITRKTYGDIPFTISQPTSNSDGIFSYSSSDTLVATISGNTITIVGPGITTITATQTQTTNYSSGTVTTAFQVDKITPTINSFSIPTKRYGTRSFIIPPPTSTSNGSFTYLSSDTSIATISGNTITIVGAGIATITSTQSETEFYNSGTITTSIQVNKAIPIISNFSIPIKNYGDSSFTIPSPTSNSNGTFSYVSSDTSVATISEDTITIVGVGISTITATQAETLNYTSATIFSSFQVDKAIQSITNFSIPTKTYGDIFTIPQPISNSGGTFTYISADPSVAIISGDTITIVGAGTATIIAIQEATLNYSSGTITTSFQINKASSSITGFLIPTKTYGDSPFTIPTPTSNSDGLFSYISSDSSIATISGNTITIVGVGTASIIAMQAATTNYTSGITTTVLNISSP